MYFNLLYFFTTGHANFDFNQCSGIYRMLFFSFEEGPNGQYYSSDIHHLIESPPSKILYLPSLEGIPLPLNTISKTLLDKSSNVSLCIFSSILNCNLVNQKNPAVKA